MHSTPAELQPRTYGRPTPAPLAASTAAECHAYTAPANATLEQWLAAYPDK